MPASFEFARTQITHDPNLRIDQTLPKLGSFNLIDFAEEILNIIIEHLEDIPILGDVVKALKQLLDVDGNGRLELDDLIGLLTGRGIIDAIMNGLGFLGSGFSLGALFDAITNLPMWVYNAIKGFITSVLDLGWLRITPNMIFGGDSDNMLLASDFKAAETMEIGSGWAWDGTVGRSALGSAKATASGNRLVQMSNLVRVEAGQKLDVSGWVKWSGVSASGPAFKVEAQFYNGGAVGVTAPVGAVSSPAASGGWQQITAQVTVPSGVDSMRVRISVEAAVSSGSVWWDDVECKRVGTMPQNFITNLIPDLAGLKDWIESLLNAGLGALGLPALGSIFDKIMDFADGLDDWMTDTDNTASGLDSLLGNLLSNPAAVLGTIPQSLISGLAGALANLLPKGLFDDFLGGLTGSAGGSSGGTGVPIIDGALDAIRDLFGLADGADTKATNAGSVASAAAVAAITTSTVDGFTITRRIFSSNTTWTPSAPPAGMVLKKVGVGVINGGGGGARGIVTKGTGGSGTQRSAKGGGYAYSEFTPAAVGSSQSVTVGAGGSASSSASPTSGGASSFGSLLSGVSGVSGIRTLQGAIASSCQAGDGGMGGLAWNNDDAAGGAYARAAQGLSGMSSALSVGGSGGDLGSNGGAGGTTGSDSVIVSGGSGGGGGGGHPSSAGNGGNGSSPGGAGGSGGNAWNGITWAGNAGSGAPGLVFTIEFFGAP